jgi:hypothetical protein
VQHFSTGGLCAAHKKIFLKLNESSSSSSCHRVKPINDLFWCHDGIHSVFSIIVVVVVVVFVFVVLLLLLQ